MRSSVDIQFSVCLIRIIPEPSFPSQGSQARGTRLALAASCEELRARTGNSAYVVTPLLCRTFDNNEKLGTLSVHLSLLLFMLL
jgi:hypothetical protein